MNRLAQMATPLVCLALLFAGRPATAADGILAAIPSDALALALVHDLDKTSATIDDLAELVGAPEPDLLPLFKYSTGLVLGLDKNGDAAIVLTAVDPAPRVFFLLPVSDYDALLSGLNADDLTDAVVEVQLGATRAVIGRKGSYAVITRPQDKAALEEFIADESGMADEKLARGIEDSRITAVLTRRGVEVVLPKLVVGVQMMQAAIRQMGGDQGQFAADAMNMYIELFNAAEGEVEQFAIALGVADDRTVTLVKRAQFTPDGKWGQWVANVKPANDQLAGLPAEPYIAAFSMVMPEDGMKHMMEFSLQAVKGQLTPEQASRYIELTAESMKGVHSMKFLLGVPEKGTGLYGNTVAMMTVDDPSHFLESYKAALNEMATLADQAKSPFIPKMSAESIKVEGRKALEVTTKLTEFSKNIPSGGPDVQEVMELLTGPSGELKIYVAPAGENSVAIAYTSLERLTSELEFLKSGKDGLADEDQIKTASASLPTDSQFVAYVSLSGIGQAIKQLAPEQNEGPMKALEEMPASPPIAMAGHAEDGAAEFRLVIAADTLKAIGEAARKAHGEP